MSVRLLAALALIMFTTAPVYAQSPDTDAMIEASNIVGTLVGVEGDVSLMPADAEPQPLKLNDPVHMNDVIETGAGARAFVLLIDNTEITLGENAQLTIDEYIFDEESTSANKGRYSILRGAFLYTSGLVAKKENPDVRVNTPYGSVGIRGTTFWGGEIDDSYGILVTDGMVSVQTERGRINVDKGQGTSLRAKTSIPSRAATWSQEKVDRAVQTIALKDADGVRARVAAVADKQQDTRLKHKEYINQQQLKKQDAPRMPIKRIDNAPLPPVEKKTWIGDVPKSVQETARPAAVKPVNTKPVVLDDVAPETETEPLKAPVDDDLNKPFKPEPKASQTSPEPLLKAAPTNTPPDPVVKPESALEDKDASAVPPVELPAMGENEAHTNELREQQDIQRRQDAARSKAAGAL